MIAALILGREHTLVVADHVILQFAHRLELHARHFLEGLGSLVQRMLWRRLQRMAVLVEIRTEHRHRGDLCKGIDKGRTETRQHIEVARSCLDEREEAGAVDTLATGKDSLQVVEVVDHEIQRLQLSVATRIHEVHHADLVVYDVLDDVGLGKLGRWFLQCRHDRIGIQHQVFVVHNSVCCFEVCVIMSAKIQLFYEIRTLTDAFFCAFLISASRGPSPSSPSVGAWDSLPGGPCRGTADNSCGPVPDL